MSPLITITETEPTPLLKDFEAFAAYVKTRGARLTAGDCIGGRDLYELNRLMTEPLPDVTPRTRQAMYPSFLSQTAIKQPSTYLSRKPHSHAL